MHIRFLQRSMAVAAMTVLLMAGFPVAGEEPGGGGPSLPPEAKACVQKILGEERMAAIMNGGEPTAAEKESLRTCFAGPRPGEGTAGGPQVEMTPELRACLLAAVGEERFTAISGGQSQPTDDEKQKGMKCFEKTGVRPPKIDTGRKIPPDVAECLKLALGEERYNAITSGKATPSLDDRKAGESCFGATPGAMTEGVKPQMSPQLFECLKKAVGIDRFRQISTGKSEPTEAEHQAGQACFTKFNRTESNESVLPPPISEVPFLEERETSVDIKKITVSEKNGTDSITVKGKGPKKSVVDLHLMYKDTTVTTQTNAKGDWSYTIKRKIPGGDYDVYATTRAGKKTVRTGAEGVKVK